MRLNRYIASGEVKVPPVQSVGGTRLRAWKKGDVEQVKQLLRIKNGRRMR